MDKQKQKNPYFTLKRIQNLSKPKKIVKRRPFLTKESIYFCSPPPPKFLNPFPFHRTLSDLVIFDVPQQINRSFISPLYCLLNLKHIASIDYQDDFILVNLEDSGNYPFSPVDLLVSGLNSLNHDEAYNFANSLQQYFDCSQVIMKAASYTLLAEDKIFQQKLIYVKDYLSQVASNSITEKEFFDYFTKFQHDNLEVPNFCLVYSEFKPFFGMEIKNLILSNSLKRIMPCNDLDFIDEDFLCMESKEYFKIMTETVMTMHSAREPEGGYYCHVKTKIGLKKMHYDIRRFYILKGTSKRKVMVHCIFKKDKQLAEINENLKKFENGYSVVFDNISFMKKDQKIEKNQKWNKLIDFYFGSFNS